MAINVNIPANWQLPLFWAQVDGSMAGNILQVGRALFVSSVEPAELLVRNGGGQRVHPVLVAEPGFHVRPGAGGSQP